MIKLTMNHINYEDDLITDWNRRTRL